MGAKEIEAIVFEDGGNILELNDTAEFVSSCKCFLLLFQSMSGWDLQLALACVSLTAHGRVKKKKIIHILWIRGGGP